MANTVANHTETHAEAHTDHVVAVKTYVAVFLSLIVLTWVTVAISKVDLGGILNTVAALTIAVCKATLVILWFMHVKYSTKLTKLVVAAGFLWLLLMLVLMMMDYSSRTWLGFGR